MTHSDIIIHSGDKVLQKYTKTQVSKSIREIGNFHGILVGNKVNHYHICDGWALGYEIDVTTIEEFNKKVKAFERGLSMAGDELGTYPHYYEIINEKGEC